MTDDTLTMTETPEIDSAAHESPEDSARAVIEELGGLATDGHEEADEQLPGDEGANAEKPTIDASEAARVLAKQKGKGKPKKQVVEGKDLQAEPEKPVVEGEPTQRKRIDPPARFPVEKKELFNKLAPELQEELARGWNEIEGQTNKIWQEMRREQANNRAITETVSHYLPKWNASGMGAAEAIRQLCAWQDEINADPLDAIDRMMQHKGITPEMVYQRRQGQPVQHQQPQQSASNALTVEEAERIWERKQQNILRQQQIQAGQQEFYSVRNEMTEDGRYAYPELHDQRTTQRVQPFVEIQRETHPGKSWADWFREGVRAYRIASGQQPQTFGSPSASTGPKLSQDDIAKAKRASVSVVTRGNGVIPSTPLAQAGESHTESARAILAMFNKH